MRSMRSSIQPMAETFTTEHRKKRRWLSVMNVMAALVVFVTTYALILPAITWERTLICEKPEHTHTEACYELVTEPGAETLICEKPEHTHGPECYETQRVLVCGLEEREADGESEGHTHTEACWQEVEVLTCTLEAHTHGPECVHVSEGVSRKVLTCGLEEHVHTDTCFDAPPAADEGVFCGYIEHKHNELCYFEDGELRCTIPEHTHTAECECDPAADTETPAVWEQTISRVELTGDWGADVLAIAESQLGYTESTRNFEVQPNGISRKGYTRYGAWYGVPYGDWCAMFCSFCMDYAHVARSRMPQDSNCPHWIETLSNEKYDLYHENDTYLPVPGDLIFFDWDVYTDEADREADHVGLVAELIYNERTGALEAIRTIEGNSGNRVQYVRYAADDDRIMGYGEMPQLVSVEAEVERECLTLRAECHVAGSYEWQWQLSDDGEHWEDIPGATSLTCTLPVDDGAMERFYRICAVRRQLLRVAASADSTSELIVPEEFRSRAIRPEAMLNVCATGLAKLVIAGSDFQDPETSYTGFSRSGSYTNQVSRITNMMTAISNTYGDAYGFIAGGDYGFDSGLNETKTRTGVTAVRNAVTAKFGSGVNMLFVQGNHDAAISEFASTGAHDTDYYGAFIINEDNYASKPGTGAESAVQTAANQLSSYLAAKVSAHYDKPVFICTHVPLHFSTRTAADGDAMYADTLYNAIYPYGDDLNIIFLFGHDHAWGDDDYLGGASVFLTRGDTINIANHGSKTKFTAKPLNFTYLNYGYTGYYWSKWADNSSGVKYSNADSTLTMTAFAITGSDVVISRWEENAQHPTLKSVGKASQGNRGVAETCTVTTNTYSNPQTVTAPGTTQDPEPEEPALYEVPGTGSVLSAWDQLISDDRLTGGSSYSAVRSALHAALGADYSFNLYDIVKAQGATVPSGGADVYLPVSGETEVFGYENGSIVWYDDAEPVTVDGASYMRFAAPHFSLYGTLGSEITQVPESEFEFPPMAEPSTIYWMKCTAAGDFTANGTYMIVSQSGYALGINDAGSAKTSTAAQFTEDHTDAGKTYYTLSGTAASDHYRFTLMSGGQAGQWRLKCLTSTGTTTATMYGVRLDQNDEVIATNPNGSLKLEAGQNGSWIIRRNGQDQRLDCDDTGTFKRTTAKTAPATASMLMYKMVEVPGRTYSGMLAVQNYVTAFNSLVSAETPFLYRLTYCADDSYANAQPVTGEYTLYDADGEVIGTEELSNSGTFTLKAGQTALFDVPPSGHYYVAQANSDDVERVLADVNGAGATVTGDSSYQWAAADFADGHSLVRFSNTPMSDESYLEIRLRGVGIEEGVTEESEFVFTVEDADGEPAVWSVCQILDEDLQPVGEGIEYDPAHPEFALRLGQTARLYDLDEGSYTIVQSFGDNAEYIHGVTAAVNETGAEVNFEESGNALTGVRLTVGHSGRTGVEMVDRFGGVCEITFDYGDGTFEVLYTDEEGHIAAPWPEKERSGMEFKDWHTKPYIEGVEIDASEQSGYTFTRDTTLYAHWLPFTVQFETDAKISKALREATAYNDDYNPENIFDIDLNVSLPSTGDQVIVLVFDLSSSMDVQCAVCGGIHEGSRNTSETHDTYYQGETYNGVVQGRETTTYCSSFSKRLPIAKEQANAFIHQLKASLDPGQNCYIEIVGFAKEAWEVLPVTNLSASNGESTVISAINGMAADSGTNIASGLKMGYEKLTQIVSANNIDRNNSYVILLSDGAPTTNNATMQSGYSNPSSQYYLNAEAAVTTEYIEKWKAIWSQYDHYRWNDTGFDTSVNNAKYYNIRQVMATPYYADMIRDFGAKIYSVAFGVNMDSGYWKGANNFKYVGGIGIDNFDYVTSFSDEAQFAVTGTDLANFYNGVISSIDVVCSDAVVTDPMSENVEFLYFTDENGDELSAPSGYGYDPDTGVITWYPTDSGTVSYKVRLKNEMAGFEDWAENSKAYLTNGITTFDYKIQAGTRPIESKHKTADIPHVHGWLGELDFTKVGGVTWQDAQALPGATFTLTHDPQTCPVCRILIDADHEAQCADIGAFTATSDPEGRVSFEDIPSGHSYLLSEVSPPNEYEAAEDYVVTVAYDNVSFQTTASSVNWDGEAGKMWDPFIGSYELPSTGSPGLIPIIAFGAVLCALAVLFGFSMRRKRERRSER